VAIASCLLGQQIHFGIVGGMNLTHSFHPTHDHYMTPDSEGSEYMLDVLFFSRSRNFIFGPSLELTL